MANLAFYMTPGSCSTGIHVLLEELDLFFEAHVVDLMAGDNRRPEFLALNPRGSVPVLVRSNGAVLADFIAIAVWLAESHPKHALLPSSADARAHALQVMEYVLGVVHGEGFTRVFMADRYASDAEDRKATEGAGHQIVRQGFQRLETMFLGSPYVAGAFSVADAALFYVEFWAERVGLALPTRCETHYRAMLKRPAVRRVLGEEGYQSVLRKYPA